MSEASATSGRPSSRPIACRGEIEIFYRKTLGAKRSCTLCRGRRLDPRPTRVSRVAPGF